MTSVSVAEAVPPMRQMLLDLLPPPSASFENFVVGRNEEMLASLRTWLQPVENDGQKAALSSDAQNPTCFLLWGAANSGGHHLLTASGWPLVDCRSRQAGAGQILACKNSDIAIAGVDHLDADGQIALFNAYNQRKLSGGKLLVSSRQPPAALALREDLRTRLGSGLIYRLHALSDAEKADALRTRAAALGLELPEHCLAYIFQRAPRDMGFLITLVDALNRFTLRHKKTLTLPVLKPLLDRAMNEYPPAAPSV